MKTIKMEDVYCMKDLPIRMPANFIDSRPYGDLDGDSLAPKCGVIPLIVCDPVVAFSDFINRVATESVNCNKLIDMRKDHDGRSSSEPMLSIDEYVKTLAIASYAAIGMVCNIITKERSDK